MKSKKEEMCRSGCNTFNPTLGYSAYYIPITSAFFYWWLIMKQRKNQVYPGEKYGRLTVIREVSTYSERTGWQMWHAECICDCGEKRVVRNRSLKRGSTQSCGCYNRERVSETHKNHGLTGHPTLTVWAAMRARCVKKEHHAYPRYGGRGIKICDRWRDNFQNFYDDMVPTYKPGLQIDRIDNDGDYTPENCRWATPRQNMRNRRNIKKVDYKGQTYCVAGLAEKLGIKYETLQSRIRAGRPVDAPIDAEQARRSGSRKRKVER